jgi:hypothetical protein
VKFIKHDFKWAKPLQMRVGFDGTAWHHLAAKTMTPLAIHKLHLSFGWSGAYYCLYIRKNGTVHILRPLRFVCCGCLGSFGLLGVVVEGNYDTEEEMPAAQLRACQEVHDWIDETYGKKPHIPHKQVPNNATACPGRHFPWKAIMEGVPKTTPVALTTSQITFPRMYNVKRGWYTLGFKPWFKKVKKQCPKRVIITRETVQVPVPVKKPWWWEKALEYRASRRIILRAKKRRFFDRYKT